MTKGGRYHPEFLPLVQDRYDVPHQLFPTKLLVRDGSWFGDEVIHLGIFMDTQKHSWYGGWEGCDETRVPGTVCPN